MQANSNEALDIANALNSGRKFPWPKGASAIRVRRSDGKTATVLKNNADTLKHSGIDDKATIVFGRIHFDRNGRPNFKQFETIQQFKARDTMSTVDEVPK